MLAGDSFQRNREKTRRVLFRCVTPEKELGGHTGASILYGLAEKCVMLIRKIWFREVLDFSNNEIIIPKFQADVKR